MSYFHAINGQGGSPEPTPSNDHPPVLLWTNPSPTSEFAEQKVDLDLTGYIGVIVEYAPITSTAVYSRLYVKKSDTLALGNDIYLGGGYTQLGSSESRAYSRSITAIDDTGITFSKCVNGAAVQNFNCVPTKIYGVQEYVAESENAMKPIPSDGIVNLGYQPSVIVCISQDSAGTNNVSIYNKEIYTDKVLNMWCNESGTGAGEYEIFSSSNIIEVTSTGFKVGSTFTASTKTNYYFAVK